MKTIHKFRLPVADASKIVMPIDAEVISVQHVSGDPVSVLTLWAEVDNCADQREFTFYVCGTGHKLPVLPPDVKRRHIATVQAFPFVWHVFDAKRI